MLRRSVLSLATALVAQLCLFSLANAQDTMPQPAQPPTAEPAPATPPSTPPAAEPVPPSVAQPAPPAAQPTPPVAQPSPPAAQPSPPPGEVVVGEPAGRQERTEEIVVTGSRIRRKDLNTPAPVAIINKETIQASGKVSIGDFLQALPEQGNAVNTQVNNGNDGSVNVSLRSLGSDRTLVLVNGRRMVNGGTSQGASPDLNTIPAAAVERIEILKDGASAVYGSDAIAGVVNVILKKRFDGTEVSAYDGASYKGDGTTYDLSAITGTSSDRGNILFSVGYQQQKQVLAGDRPWSETTFDYNFLTGQRSPTGNSSTFPQGRFSLPVELDADGNVVGCLPGGTALYTSLCNTAMAENYNGFVPGGGTTYSLYDGSAYNTNPTNYLITPNRRIQLFSTGDTNIGNVARGYFEASYVNRTSAQNLAPMPLVNNSIPTAPVTISKDSLYNPFGVDVTSWRRRTVEFGNRDYKQDLDTFRVVTGVDGSLGDWASFLRGWTWDLSYSYGRTAGTDTTAGQLRMPAVANATGPSMRDPVTEAPTCVRVADDISTRIPGCVPVDVLHGVGTLDAAAKDYLTFTGTYRSAITQEIYSANASGDLFRLFADRPVGLAAGFDFRRETGSYIPDPIAVAAESSGNNQLATSGAYDVKEGYAELSVPLIGNVPWAQEVEASGAVRVVDYTTFGTNTSYKAGARWSPFRDVSFRGTYSTAFRAPNIPELFGGTADSYPTLRDPCNNPNPEMAAFCAAHGVPGGNSRDPSTQLLEKWIASPDLKPETAKIYTAGVVFQPRWVPNLSATLDYYSIKVDQYIALTGATFIMDRCYRQHDESMCAFVDRGPDGRVLQINDYRVNRYDYETAGLDFAVRYALPTPGFGRFNFLVDGTLLQFYRQIDRVNGDVTSARGNYDLGLALPTFKFNAGVAWAKGGLGAGVTTRYVGAFRECASGVCSSPGGEVDGVRTISAYMPFDAFVSYAVKSSAGRTSVAAGVQNVLNTQPPYIYWAADANSDPSTYDYLGRFFYVRLTQGF